MAKYGCLDRILLNQGIGQIIRAKRKSLGITATALVEDLGLDRSQLTRLEKGQRMLRPETFIRLLDYLDIKIILKIDTKEIMP